MIDYIISLGFVKRENVNNFKWYEYDNISIHFDVFFCQLFIGNKIGTIYSYILHRDKFEKDISKIVKEYNRKEKLKPILND